MSFRTKLISFFVLVVLVPMLSVAFVLFNLIGDNETGKAEARLASRQAVAVNLARDARERADLIAIRVGEDPAVAAAIRARDAPRLARRLRALRDREGAKRIAIVSKRVPLADTGGRDAVFPTFRELRDSAGRTQGTVQVSTAEARRFADRVASVTGLGAAVAIDGRVAASTVPGVEADSLPQAEGVATALGASLHAASYEFPGFDGQVARVTVLESAAVADGDRRQSRLLIAALLLGFLILAVTLAWFVARSLHGQMERFLVAARRIGEGDFSERVPTAGGDDFAALGEEFNKMSEQLESRLEDLRVERERLRGAMRRIGVAIASNLDRDGLLQVVVSASADGVGADAGRATVRSGPGAPLVTVAAAGDLRELGRAIGDVEARALMSGIAVEDHEDGVALLALPLRLRTGGTEAAVAIARVGSRFTTDERELVEYLAAQAATSIENVALHERAEEQAVTDALTGLANRRHFEQRLVEEVERSRRSREPAGLLMLDIDNFKQVNDLHGHVAGDTVLRAVAAVLRETAREIDLAARYGGEEFALILPGAGLAGAGQVGERVRAAVEAREISIDGAGDHPLRVTVSVGAAALGHGPEEARSLVAAADEALYRAKRLGKNRAELAGAAAASLRSRVSPHMGLLDDAIREHLELKRRSGADPGDVARQEDEVFGEHTEVPEQSTDETADSEPEADPRPAAESDPGVHVAADVLDDGEEPESPGEPGQPTRQFTAVEREDAERSPARERAEPAPAEDEEVHDELEDTPDFLQETPEHDRLWFEQKPPRDFDF